MNFYEDTTNVTLIKNYDKNQALVGDKIYKSSFLLTPKGLIEDLTILDIAKLDSQFILSFFNDTNLLDTLILGTGQNLVEPSTEFLLDFFKLNIGVEYMQNHSACKTYNILAQDLRNVALILLINNSNDI